MQHIPKQTRSLNLAAVTWSVISAQYISTEGIQAKHKKS